MSAIGGSIETINLDGREFPVTSDADVSRKLGGFENEMLSNGDGSARQIKTRVPWALTGVVIEMDDERGDDEFIQALADRSDNYPIFVTYASGVVYQGTGQIVGESTSSSQSASKTLDLMGPGKLTQQ